MARKNNSARRYIGTTSHFGGRHALDRDRPLEKVPLAATLPTGYNDLVMSVKRRFDEEVAARQAERRHTLSLTKAQRYVRRELRVAYGQADSADLRGQINRLEEAFTRAVLLPAVRSELNRMQHDGLRGMTPVEALSQVYHLHGLDERRVPARLNVEENNDLPQIVCSEALL